MQPQTHTHLPAPRSGGLVFVRNMTQERQNQTPGELGGRIQDTAGSAHQDVTVRGGLHIDGGVAHARCGQ